MTLFLTPILTQTKVVTINGGTNVDLYSQAGSPSYPLYIYAYVNSPVSSTSSSTPALKTGTGWSQIGRAHV